MTAKAKRVLEEALSLPPKARSEVAERLLVSLHADSPAEVEEAWDEEIALRLKEIDEGKVKMIPGDVVRKRLREIARGHASKP